MANPQEIAAHVREMQIEATQLRDVVAQGQTDATAQRGLQAGFEHLIDELNVVGADLEHMDAPAAVGQPLETRTTGPTARDPADHAEARNREREEAAEAQQTEPRARRVGG